VLARLQLTPIAALDEQQKYDRNAERLMVLWDAEKFAPA
jgi:hypothetical protein